jgi:Uma2 family endonuclease
MMAAITRTTRMTADEFLNDPSIPERAELVHGEVRVVAPAFNAHGLVCRAIFLALHAHAATRQLGEALPHGFAYRLPHRDDTVRVPDASFVRAGRLPAELPLRGVVRMAPDLAVEVLSDSDTPSVVRKKVNHHLEAGTALVWLVDLDERGVEVRTADAAARWLGEGDTLDGGPVLPDFALPVAELFRGIARDG